MVKDSLISKGEYARNTKYGPDGTAHHPRGRGRAVPADRRSTRRGGGVCQELKITFFSSCFSRSEVDLLESLDVPAYKIASMDATISVARVRGADRKARRALDRPRLTR